MGQRSVSRQRQWCTAHQRRKSKKLCYVKRDNWTISKRHKTVPRWMTSNCTVLRGCSVCSCSMFMHERWTHVASTISIRQIQKNIHTHTRELRSHTHTRNTHTFCSQPEYMNGKIILDTLENYTIRTTVPWIARFIRDVHSYPSCTIDLPISMDKITE